MSEFGKYRYKTFEEKSHWLPGFQAFNTNIDKIDLSKVPANIPLKKMLAESHHEFFVSQYKNVIINEIKNKVVQVK
jgi:predicted aldo/keto reductase-like oxidoreductase